MCQFSPIALKFEVFCEDVLFVYTHTYSLVHKYVGCAHPLNKFLKINISHRIQLIDLAEMTLSLCRLPLLPFFFIDLLPLLPQLSSLANLLSFFICYSSASTAFSSSESSSTAFIEGRVDVSQQRECEHAT